MEEKRHKDKWEVAVERGKKFVARDELEKMGWVQVNELAEAISDRIKGKSLTTIHTAVYKTMKTIENELGEEGEKYTQENRKKIGPLSFISPSFAEAIKTRMWRMYGAE